MLLPLFKNASESVRVWAIDSIPVMHRRASHDVFIIHSSCFLEQKHTPYPSQAQACAISSCDASNDAAIGHHDSVNLGAHGRDLAPSLASNHDAVFAHALFSTVLAGPAGRVVLADNIVL